MPLLTLFGWRTALWAVAALVAAFMAAGPLLELRSLRGQADDLRAELAEVTRRAELAEAEVGQLRRAVADHLERIRNTNAAVAKAEAKRQELERQVRRARRAAPARKKRPNTDEPAHRDPDPVDDVLRRLRDQERADPPGDP